MYEEILEKLTASKNYANVCRETLERVVSECASRYKKPKDIEKAAKEHLHGITGAFMTADERKKADTILNLPNCAEHLEELLALHASTRERLPLSAMDAMYAKIFSVTGKPEIILDLACGLNPIYLGARGFSVFGMDIQNAAIERIQRFAERYQLPVRAVCADLLTENSLPREHFSLALLLKLLPILETQRTGSAKALLEAIPAEHIVVSYPTRTLTGRNIGMENHYSQWMEQHLPENRAVLDRFSTDTELIYILGGKTCPNCM